MSTLPWESTNEHQKSTNKKILLLGTSEVPNFSVGSKGESRNVIDKPTLTMVVHREDAWEYPFIIQWKLNAVHYWLYTELAVFTTPVPVPGFEPATL